MDGASANGVGQTAAAPALAAQAVRRRHVFFIPGFDPHPARRYRELYRREAAAQAAISGHELTVEAAPGGWQVTARIAGLRVETRVEVLVWSDIVRGSMRAGLAGLFVPMLRTGRIYLRSGAPLRLARLRRGPVLAGCYAPLMLAVQAALALAAAILAAGLAARSAAPELALPAAATGAGGAGLAMLLLFRWLDRVLFVRYLMHDLAFAARHSGAYPPELEARLARFRARVAAALAGGCDEVLVVGHSSGAHLAVSVLAVLRRDGLPDGGPVLGLLTLGQVVPMLTFLPGAGRLRRDLHDLSAQDRIAWVDVSSPGDVCCFALCDPVAVSGVAPAGGSRWPLVISAAFSRTLDAGRHRRLRWRFFRLHFQYLCAFDRPGRYDYFAITAGPETLAARFALCPASPGRRCGPVSPYRGMAP